MSGSERTYTGQQMVEEWEEIELNQKMLQSDMTRRMMDNWRTYGMPDVGITTYWPPIGIK